LVLINLVNLIYFCLTKLNLTFQSTKTDEEVGNLLIGKILFIPEIGNLRTRLTGVELFVKGQANFNFSVDWF
jgi:hypothetical protein